MSLGGSTGLLGSLRELGDGVLRGIQGRLELVSVEFQEEKVRLIQTLIWISVALFTGMMALVFVSLTVVYLFWERARLTVLIVLAAVYLAAFIAVVRSFKRHLARQPAPFEGTLREIAADRSCIPPET